jgi:hypothetical protein
LDEDLPGARLAGKVSDAGPEKHTGQEYAEPEEAQSAHFPYNAKPGLTVTLAHPYSVVQRFTDHTLRSAVPSLQ